MIYFNRQIKLKLSLRKGKLFRIEVRDPEEKERCHPGRVIEGRKTVHSVLNAGQAGYRKT